MKCRRCLKKFDDPELAICQYCGEPLEISDNPTPEEVEAFHDRLYRTESSPRVCLTASMEDQEIPNETKKSAKFKYITALVIVSVILVIDYIFGDQPLFTRSFLEKTAHFLTSEGLLIAGSIIVLAGFVLIVKQNFYKWLCLLPLKWRRRLFCRPWHELEYYLFRCADVQCDNCGRLNSFMDQKCRSCGKEF